MANSADPDQLATDLDLHCLQRQGISGFSRTRVENFISFSMLSLSALTGLYSFRSGPRRISEGVRFNHITLLSLRIRTDRPEQTV